MRNACFDLRPLAPALGAELIGVDLATELDDAMIAPIRTALLEHQVVFFRDQSLDTSALKRFAGRFGPLTVHPMIRTDDAHPEVLRIVKEPADRKNFGGDWHSDVTYLAEPALGSILY